MVKEYTVDLSVTPLVIATSGSDAHVTIPNDLPNSPMSSPNATGSLYSVNVNGAAVGIRYGANAVFGTSATYEIGNNVFGGQCVRIPPGTVVHAITGGGTGFVSIVRYRRAT
jgi:hypothetical protein